MRLLIIGLVLIIGLALLLAGTGEAGDDWKIISVYPEDSISCCQPVRAIAGEQPDGNHGWIKTDKNGYVIPSPCYERMRESMKAVDAYNKQEQVRHEPSIPLTMDLNIGMQLKKQWDAVMRECVRQ